MGGIGLLWRILDRRRFTIGKPVVEINTRRKICWVANRSHAIMGKINDQVKPVGLTVLEIRTGCYIGWRQ